MEGTVGRKKYITEKKKLSLELSTVTQSGEQRVRG